jgi:hypothetical protein
VQAAAASVARGGGELVFQFDDRSPEEGGGRFFGRSGGSGSGGAVPRIHITIFHCHFDANFRNWHCYLGPHREAETT